MLRYWIWPVSCSDPDWGFEQIHKSLRLIVQLNTPCRCLYSKCVYNAIKGCIFVLWSVLVFKIAVIFLSLLPKITFAHVTPFVLPGQRISCTETFLVLHKKVLHWCWESFPGSFKRTTHSALTWREGLESTVQLCDWTLSDTWSWWVKCEFLQMVLYPCPFLNQRSLHHPSLKRLTAPWPWRKGGWTGWECNLWIRRREGSRTDKAELFLS